MLQTPRLAVKELTNSDLQEVHWLHSLAEVDEFNTLGVPEDIETTECLLKTWIEHQKVSPRTCYILKVKLLTTNQFIGLVGLNLGKANFKSAELWYKLRPEHWGLGYATELTNELLEFGFSNLNLHRIEAGCALGNLASQKVLEKTGFTREGTKRKVLPIRGEWIDAYFYSILESDRK